MKPIEQLQEILCTVESVEKDVKELRFGCLVKSKYQIEKVNSYKNWQLYTCFLDNRLNLNQRVILIEDVEIIWNPLSLKHLMMYCNESKIFIEFNSSWDYWTIIDWYEGFLWKYDITKELYEQEEETLVDIINFLKG